MAYQILDNGVYRDATPEETAEINSRQQAVLADSIAQYIVQIDADTDSIYAMAIGNRQAEYDNAYAQAASYKAASYSGNVPSSVSSWATAKSWTSQQAADDIIAAGDKLSSMRDIIRGQRLLRKEMIRTSADMSVVNSQITQWNVFVTNIKAQLK